MKTSRIKKAELVFVLLTTLILTFACSEDEVNNPQAQAPDIPPQSTFVMDFDAFPDTGTPEPFNKIQADTILRGNWGFAAANVAVWNFLLTVTLAVPVASFAEAFNHQPVQQPDGSWLWTYDVVVSRITHTAKLYGISVTGGIEWRMLLTKDGFYEDFEWYTGFSNLPLTEGTWTLNKDPDNPAPFIFIEWDRNAQENTANIKYTNITPGVPESGSYIFYGITNDLPYNAFYDIFGQQQNNLIEIEWNRDLHNGRVRNEAHFGNTDWHCWDELLFDVDCLP